MNKKHLFIFKEVLVLKKKFFTMLGVMALTVSMANGAKPTNDQLVVGVAQEFETLNPLTAQMMVSHWVYYMVGRSLMTMNAKAEWVPMVVKEIPSIENGKAAFYTENGVKKIKAEWEIREGVQWGDGTPITAEDVAFTRTVALNDNVSVGEREIYSEVERIEIDKNNPRKFTFYYEKAKWDFHQKPQWYLLPKHLEEAVYEKYKDTKQGYDMNTLYTTDPTNPGLYNGPYVIEEIKLGSHIILKANKNFWGKKPNIKKIIVKLIPNTATIESNLLSGNIDMVGTIGFNFDQALAFDEKAKSQKLPYNVLFKTGTIYEHIDLQLSNPLLQDVRVRKALVHAIDRQKLVETIYHGKLQAAIHDLSPIDPWYTNDPKKIVTYKYSRKKAKDLLKDAGWELNSKDGYLYKDGKKLSFQLMTTAGNKAREMVQAYLQEEWKKVGIEITIKNEPPRVYFGETVRKSLFPAMALFAWVSSPYNTPRSTLHKESIPTEANGYSGQNDTRWVNEKASSYIEQMDTTFTTSGRTELRQKILYEYTNDVPVIPLYYRVDIAVIPKNLNGYHLTGHQFPETNNVEDWNLN